MNECYCVFFFNYQYINQFPYKEKKKKVDIRKSFCMLNLLYYHMSFWLSLLFKNKIGQTIIEAFLRFISKQRDRVLKKVY